MKGIDLRAPNSESQTRYFRVNCNCWDCSYCGPKKMKRYLWAIGEKAKELGLNRFLTLTLDPSKFLPGISFADFRELHDDDYEKQKLKRIAIAYLRACFNKLRVYLGREYGSAIKYVCVIEFHQSGMPHLHLLVDRYIPIEWIRKSWRKLGGGYQVRIEAVEVRSGAAYISKYLAKQMQSNVPARMRRITTSRSIRLLSRRLGPKHFAWQFQKQAIWTALDFYGGPSETGESRILSIDFDPENILEGFAVSNRPREVCIS